MYIDKRRLSPRFVAHSRAVVLALSVVAGFASAPFALAQGAFSPAPKAPPPAPVAPAAPAPHVVAPTVPIPPPAVVPAIPNPLANQPHSTGQGDTKRSASGDSDQPTTAPGLATGRRQYEPLLNLPLTATNKAGGAPSRIVTDGNGAFNFGKLAPGDYKLEPLFGNGGNGGVGGAELNGRSNVAGPQPQATGGDGRPLIGNGRPNVAGPQPQAVLIGLLLPAVQKAREATLIEHRFPGPDDARNMSFRIGKDGRVMALDWGDGKGPVDLAKETRYIPLPQDASPGALRGTLTSLPSSPTPQALDGEPIPGVDVNIPKCCPPMLTDSHGGFSFGKLGPGNYSLEFSAKDLASNLKGRTGTNGTAHPQEIGVLIGLLLPAVQKVRLVEHPFLSSVFDKGIKIAFRVGQDGRLMSLDWGDGKGPIDPEQEARNLPLPEGPGSGEIRGTLAYTGTTTVNPGTSAAAFRQHEPLLIRKRPLTGGAGVAVGDVNGDGKPDLHIEPNGTFTVHKLAPGDYLLGIADNDSPLPQDRVLLVALLLPAVQKVREATFIEHQFPNAGEAGNISFRMGRDGRVMALDWGDGKGPVDFAKEARRIPLPQDASPGELRVSLSPLSSSSQPQGIAGVPIEGTDVGLDHNPGGGISVSKTDNAGSFSFTKIGPGTLVLTLRAKDFITGAGPGAGPNKAAAVLFGLLLPAVGTARGNYIEHAFTGDSLGRDIKIAFRIGKNGRIMSLDWGDGKGPVDLAKEARTLPLPKGALPGELRGTLAIFDRWGNL